jgi:hypothetical protein
MRLSIWLLALAGISRRWPNYTRFASCDWRAFLRVGVYVPGIILAILVVRAGDLPD